MADESRSGIRSVPREVRLMIWNCLLGIGPVRIDARVNSGGIIPRWPADGAIKEVKPSVAILRLSQDYVEEMEHVLYSCNTYVLTSEESIERFLVIMQMNGRDRRPLLHHIQIGLGFYDICQTKDLQVIGQQVELAIGSADLDAILNGTENVTSDQQAGDYWIHHVLKKRFRNNSWRRKLLPVAAGLNPRRFTLDLRNAYCNPKRCCSMESTALMQLKHVKFAQGVPELRILGMRGFSDSMPSTAGEELVHSLWKSWTESDAPDAQCIEAEKALEKEMEQEVDRGLRGNA